MKIVLLVGAGGFIGSVLRYLLSDWIQNRMHITFPVGTMTVNIVGCFVIGLLFAFSGKGQLSMDWRLFLTAGFCGGFTTFSAFSIETINLLKQGQYTYAFTYIIVSVAVGLLATYAGILTPKMFSA